jgi:hypothetical protein
MWRKLVPPELEGPLADVPAPWKRFALATFYSLAVLQRMYGERNLASWSPPRIRKSIELDVITLACERDRLVALRMVHSFLANAGRPTSFTVVSDGSLSRATSAALQNLSKVVRVVAFSDVASERDVDDMLMRFASKHPFGMKFALLTGHSGARPVLWTDTDVIFFRGARRLAHYVSTGDTAPRYMQEPSSGYDDRLLTGIAVLPGVNAGFCLFPKPINWDLALERIGPYVDSPTFVTEQTAVAIAFTQAHALPFPPTDFIVTWDDIKWPWDAYAHKDIVARHYASWLVRWKLWLKGGPAGVRTLPRATIDYALRSFLTHAGSALYT